MSDKPYAELKGIAEKIENESFKALNFGMPAQEMILSSVEAIRR